MKQLFSLSLLLLLFSCTALEKEKLSFTNLYTQDSDLKKNWIGNLKGYKSENGVLTSQAKCGNIYTAREYQDYLLRFEFKLAPHANNGIGLRAPHPNDKSITKHDPAYSTVELQILDNTHPKYKNLKPYQFHGSA